MVDKVSKKRKIHKPTKEEPPKISEANLGKFLDIFSQVISLLKIAFICGSGYLGISRICTTAERITEKSVFAQVISASAVSICFIFAIGYRKWRKYTTEDREINSKIQDIKNGNARLPSTCEGKK